MIAAVIIIFIILIIFYNIFNWNTRAYEDYMYGCWVAEDDAFCEDAEIDSMMIFIGEPESKGIFGSTVRNCYLIIMTDMANDGFTLQYSPQWGGVGVGKYSVHAKVCFDEDQLWDENVLLTINVIKGTMKIRGKDSDMVYARLNKQHDITNIAQDLEGEDKE
jgi:hypothetical protein